MATQADVERAATNLRRSRAFENSVWVHINSLVAQYGAVNLGQGFPDFTGSQLAKESASQAILDGERNQYAPPIGVPDLRQALARFYSPRLGRTLNAESDITVTVGATEALYVLMSSLLAESDEVVFLQPFFDIYYPPVQIAGAKLKVVTLEPPSFKINHEELKAAFNEKTKLILINTPHNPTGHVLGLDELTWIRDLCVQYNALCISDEVYENLVYDNKKHTHISTLPDMWERTLTVSSAGKSFSLTGWKVGWVIAPPSLQIYIRPLKQFVTFSGATPLQVGIAKALDLSPPEYFEELRQDYQKKRDFLMGVLEEVGLPPYCPDGGYFVMADIRGTGFTDDFAFCEHLIKEVGVAAIPPSPFYLDEDKSKASTMVRFAICKKWETLHAAAERLRKKPFKKSETN